MISTPAVLRRLRLPSLPVYASSLASIALCVGLWIQAKTVSQEERGNAERRALFVGLWPPTLWLIADTVARFERRRGLR